jgi:hypothetical protein
MALALILAGLPAAAWASGADVLADYEDNGYIDHCYTATDYQQALAMVRSDRQQYGNEVGEIQRARLQQLRRPGKPCRVPAPVTSSAPADAGDSGGTSPFVWVGVAAAVGVVAIGAGAIVRRRRDG